MIWVPWEGPGLEHFRLTVHEDWIDADGLVVGVAGGRAFRVRYSLRCDRWWRVREVRAAGLDGEQPRLHLLADGAGHWATAEGSPLPLLDGCLDVDLTVTPFTNTLPIRRLDWRRGASSELTMAYVDVPSMDVTAERQRYTCLEKLANGGRFRFEVPATGFAVDLPVDRDGLVLDYPGLFRRVWAL